MKRILFDTNIYGLIVVDKERNAIREELSKKKFIVYGNSIIKNELRKTPRVFVDGINLRNDLLRLYREIIKNHDLEIKKKDIELAESYYKAYQELGGITSRAKLINDLTIVASATNSILDIVVSEDNKTMLSEISLKSYRLVNDIRKRPLPGFIGYEEFRKQIKK